MGGGVSIGYETSPARIYGPTMKKGQVIAFHSSKTWRIHCEASKQTSKLVKVRSSFFWLLIPVLVWGSNNFLDLKIVIDFTATWCGPCQYIQPAVDEFAEMYTDVDFIKIDVDELDVCALSISDKSLVLCLNWLLLQIELTCEWLIVWIGCGTGIRSSDNADFHTDEEGERSW